MKKFVEFIVLQNLQKSLLKELFVNYNHEIKQESIENQKQLIPKIINKAYCISKKVFWITEPIAWSQDMMESYKTIPLVMRDINKKDHVFTFSNHESLGRYMIQQKNIIKNIVQTHKQIILIDSHDFIKKEISKKNLIFLSTLDIFQKKGIF